MTAWGELTTEQREIIAEYTRQQRAVVGEFARLLNKMSASDAMYDGQVVAAWASLPAGDIIADNSGLAGVSSLSKAEVASIASAIEVILQTYNMPELRQLYVKMAGMVNTI